VGGGTSKKKLRWAICGVGGGGGREKRSLKGPRGRTRTKKEVPTIKIRHQKQQHPTKKKKGSTHEKRNPEGRITGGKKGPEPVHPQLNSNGNVFKPLGDGTRETNTIKFQRGQKAISSSGGGETGVGSTKNVLPG